MAASPREGRLAVDIGGTFTDVVLECGEHRHSAKVLTTPEAPERAVIDGIELILDQARITPGQVGVFVHGTTLATNALIERRGARTALLTTAGMRDILEMSDEKRFEQYDVFIDRPRPLVARALRFEVTERMLASGTPLLDLDESALPALAAGMRAADIEALAIGFLHAWRNGEHEQRARERLQPLLPGVTICLSSEVCPEMREYERFSTTVANAYVRPLMAGYLGRLGELARAAGLVCPIYLMQSGGGLTTLEQARRYPIRLLESGPAGGAIFAAHVAAQCGLQRVMSFDMGGTTAKIALIEAGRAEKAQRFEAAREYRDVRGSGLPIRVPTIEMVEIGAGGGSIAHVDPMARLCVGPVSAASVPGPACFGRGGTRPTVTDANLAMGKIDPVGFAGGALTLDSDAAERALADLGRALELEGDWAAVGVTAVVEENMANAARIHAIERGKSLGRFALVAYGGGAALHAAELARKLGIDTVVIPRGAGVGSAIGFLRAPLAFEVVRSLVRRLDAIEDDGIDRLLADMTAQAAAIVASAQVSGSLTVTREARLRYQGQGHELTVAVPEGALDRQACRALAHAFEADYQRIYGMVVEGMAVESVSWSVQVALPTDDAPEPRAVAPDDVPRASVRRLVDGRDGSVREAACHWRESLPPGLRIRGPAVIAEAQTSVVVPADFEIERGPADHLLMRRLDPEAVAREPAHG